MSITESLRKLVEKRRDFLAHCCRGFSPWASVSVAFKHEASLSVTGGSAEVEEGCSPHSDQKAEGARGRARGPNLYFKDALVVSTYSTRPQFLVSS